VTPLTRMGGRAHDGRVSSCGTSAGPTPAELPHAPEVCPVTAPPGSPGAPFPPGTFAADPRPAPPLRRITATAGLELRLTLRNGEQLLLALVIPLIALIGGTAITLIELPEPRIDAVLPGVVVLAVFSSAFTSKVMPAGASTRTGCE